MLRSFNALQAASLSRIQSVPVSPVPALRTGQEAALEAFRQRNAVLDWVFYDVKVVGDGEARAIGPNLAAEGAILLVPPSGAGDLTLCNSVDEFLRAGGAEVRTLAVAGVGSSALGAAALARNVADAVSAPVAAVVSGYGLSDIATEALGGFFLFGAVNAIRHNFEWMDRLRETGTVTAPTPSGSLSGLSSARTSKDTVRVVELLTHSALKFNLMVGHSKGNLVISEALYAIDREDRSKLIDLGSNSVIIALSATVEMPKACKSVVDVAGGFDILWALNSRLDLPRELTLACGHHTNTDLPFHLPVTKTVQDLTSRGVIPIARSHQTLAATGRRKSAPSTLAKP